MSYESHLLDDKQDKNWFMFFMKLLFILISFFLIMITVLANMGGRGDAWKGSLEAFVSGISGNRKVEVGVLNNMVFFPRIGVDASQIQIFQDDINLYPIVSIGRTQMYFSFWDVIMGSPHFSTFNLEDIRAVKGVIGMEEIHIERIFVDHDIELGTAFLRANGKVGLNVFDLKIGLSVNGSNGDFSYAFEPQFPISFKIADIAMTATFINHVDNYFKISDLNISMDEHTINGEFILTSSAQRLIKTKGRFVSESQNTELHFDTFLESGRAGRKISGDITFDRLSTELFEKTGDAMAILYRLRNIFGYEEEINLVAAYDWDVDVAFSSLSLEDETLSDVKVPVLVEDNKMVIGPIQHKDKVVLPSVLWLPQTAEEGFYLVTDGEADQDFIKHIKPYAPKEVFDREHNQCGFYAYSYDENGQAQYVSNMKTPVLLKDAPYNFVLSELGKTSEKSTCHTFITHKSEQNQDK